jgi:general secretion pathway protein G
MSPLRRSLLLASPLLVLLSLAFLPVCCDGIPLKAREAVLRTHLKSLRDVLGQYRGDKGHAPESLQALVDEGYLRTLPIDPFTKRRDTWVAVWGPTSKGVVGVHSGSSRRGSDGRTYRDW